MTVPPSLASRFATERRPRVQVRAENSTADQGHPATLFRQLGGGLDAGGTGPDHRHRGRRGHGVRTARSRCACSRVEIG